MLELPDYKMPRAAQHRDRRLYPGQDVPAARRHHDLLDDGADLVPGLVSAAARRRRRPRDQLQPGRVGKALEPLLAALGFNWQIAVALIPGMAAREVAVAALGTVYAIEGGKEAAEQIGQVLATKWSLATALSLLAWYIFAPQCASTLAVIRRETGSWQWMAVTFGYMLALGLSCFTLSRITPRSCLDGDKVLVLSPLEVLSPFMRVTPPGRGGPSPLDEDWKPPSPCPSPQGERARPLNGHGQTPSPLGERAAGTGAFAARFLPRPFRREAKSI